MKKNILIIVLLTFLSHYGFAQQPGNNIDPARDVNIELSDQYTGKWEWVSGNRTFTLVLSRSKTGFDSYFIHGWYCFSVNNKVVINQLNKLDSIKYAGLTGFVLKGNDSVKISFSDMTHDKLRRGTINFLNGKQDQILIKLQKEKIVRSLHHLNFSGKPKEYSEKLPENLNMILTRVK